MNALWQAIWIALLLPSSLLCQEESTGQLYPIKQNGQWGYMNALGAIVIQPEFDGVGNFGLFNHAPVFKGNKAGLIHVAGHLTVPPYYEDVFFLNAQLIAVKDNDYYGVMDTSGATVLEPSYTKIQLLNTNILLLYRNEKSGLINLNTKAVINPRFDAIVCLQDRYFVPELGGKFGFINEYGELIIEPIHDEVKVAGNDVILFRDSGKLWGCYNGEAKLVLQQEYEKAWPLGSELVKLRLDKAFHLYSSRTETLIKTVDVHQGNFYEMNNTVAYHLNNGKVGLIHSNGDMLLPCTYDSIEYIGQSVAITYKNGVKGIYSLTSKKELNPQFEDVQVIENVLKVRRSGLWGLANNSGELLLEPEFTKIDLLGQSGKAYNGEQLTTINLDESGRLLTENEFENFRTLRIGGYYRSAMGNATTAISFQRSNNDGSNDGWFYSTADQKWGLLNTRGDTLIRPKYDDIEVNSPIDLTLVSVSISPPVEYALDGYTISINKLYGIVKQSRGRQLGFVNYWKIYFEDFDSAKVARVIKPGGKFSLLHSTGALSTSENRFIGPFVNGRARYCVKGKVEASIKPSPEDLGSILDYLKGVSIHSTQTHSWKPVDAGELNVRISDGQWGYINTQGQVVHKSNLSFARNYWHGHAIVKVKRHFGLMDLEGNLVVPPVYGNIDFLENSGDALYRLDQYKYLYGFIDEAGKVVVQSAYRNAGYFSEGMAPVKIEGSWGYVNDAGELAIDAKFRKAFAFSDGLAAIRQRKYGYVDRDGNLVIDCQFSKAGRFREGHAPVVYKGKYGLIDRSGNFVIKPKYRMCSTVKDGLVIVKHKSKFGIKNLGGKWVAAPKYKLIDPMDQNGLAIAKKKNRYGVIDMHGNVIVGFKYQKILPFSEEMAVVRKDTRYGFVDLEGNEVIKPQFAHAGSFGDGLAPVREKKLWGYVDQNGKMVIAPQFYKATPFSEGKAMVSEGLETGMINTNGEFVFKTKAKLMTRYKEDRVVVREKGQYFFLNEYGRQVPDEYFDMVSDFENGRALVKTEGKWGVINTQGSYIFPPKYDDMELFTEGKSRVRTDAYSGLADLRGNMVMDCQYEVIRYVGDDLYRVERNDALGYLDIEGNWIWPMQR